eukprot:Skav233713  [mRNA]  locus=scaffold2120:164991:169655:+ [translate_table: standard]
MVRLAFDSTTKVGDRISLVIMPVIVDPLQQQHVAVDMISKQRFRVEGVLQEGCECHALLDVVYQYDNGHLLVMDGQSFVLGHHALSLHHLLDVVEVCCGMGWLGVGARAAGFNVILGCDMNEKFTSWYHAQHGLPVVTGSICEAATVSQIWSLSSSRNGLLGGVACQPYSWLGDQGSGSDERSSSLTGLLEAAYWLQSPMVVLECVEPCHRDAFFQCEVSKFCQETGFVRTDLTLKLEDIWPAKRMRLWCVLMHPSIGEVKVAQVPQNFGLQKISQLIPHAMSMPSEELEALRLTPEEKDAFRVSEDGTTPHELNMQGYLPTALHSWGNQLSACPCKCRNGPLSAIRLREKGLHGVVLPIPDSSDVRHIHPSELAILVAVDPYMEWEDVKFALCGLGQLASPAQAIWVCSHIKSHLDRLVHGKTISSAYRDLAAYLAWLITRAGLLWDSIKVANELAPLVQAWKPMATLHFDQLFGLDFWSEAFPKMRFSIGCILDEIIKVRVGSPLFHFMARENEQLALTDGPVDDAIAPTVPFTLDAPEWHTVRVCFMEEPSVEVLVPPGTTLSQLLEAEAQLHSVDRDRLLGFHQGCELSPECMLCEEVDPQDEAVVLTLSDSGSTPSHVERESGPLPDLMPSSDMQVDTAPVRGDMTSRAMVDGGGRAVSPLVALDATALLNLHCPVCSSTAALEGLLSQAVTTQDRLAILQNQGEVWADDEVRWHLHRLLLKHDEMKAANTKPTTSFFQHVVMVDPLLAYGWMVGGTENIYHWVLAHCPIETDCICMVVPVAAHWVPLVLKPQGGHFHVVTWDSREADHTPLLPLINMFALVFHAACVHVHREHRMFTHQGSCGSFAIAFIAQVLLHQPVPLLDRDAEVVQERYRDMFTQELVQFQTCPRPWVWGAGQSGLVARLADHLHAQGVPQENCESRANAAVKASGAKAITDALDSKNPWRQLKVVANHVRFQFLLPAELQQKIEAGAGKLKQKAKKVRSGPQASNFQLDPQKLSVAPATFHSNGNVLSQIQMTQVGPIAEGVVLTSILEAEPYLRANQVVSKFPLALLILSGTPGQIECSLPQTKLTVPCRCSLNQEPLLVDVTMVQLGHGFVEKQVESSLVKVDALDVSTVKLLVHRDEVSDWEEFTQSPMRFILGVVQTLASCDTLGCSCPKWHPAEDTQHKGALLDVWRRQFLKAGFKPERPDQAVLYSVLIRVPSQLLMELLRQSGVGGVYMEPRSPDGKAVDQDFAVIWVPKTNKANLIRLRQTVDKVLGLARLLDRWGLRTEASNAHLVREKVRPDATYLALGQRQQYEVGPMPFGADRIAISRAFKKLQWDVKAMHPTTSLANRGAMWSVVSVTDPPANLFVMSHGEVVVSRIRPQEREKPDIPKPVASSSTLHLCGAAAKAKPDPWQYDPGQFDPWQTKPDVSGPPAPSDAVLRLESKIEQAVIERLKSDGIGTTPMEQDDVPDRLSQLEANFQTLVQQHTALEQQVQESDRRNVTQLTTMQSQINHIAVQGQQLQGTLEAQQQNMGALFENQMSQIRQLLAKRTREDDDDLHRE